MATIWPSIWKASTMSPIIFVSVPHPPRRSQSGCPSRGLADQLTLGSRLGQPDGSGQIHILLRIDQKHKLVDQFTTLNRQIEQPEQSIDKTTCECVINALSEPILVVNMRGRLIAGNKTLKTNIDLCTGDDLAYYATSPEGIAESLQTCACSSEPVPTAFRFNFDPEAAILGCRMPMPVEVPGHLIMLRVDTTRDALTRSLTLQNEVKTLQQQIQQHQSELASVEKNQAAIQQTSSRDPVSGLMTVTHFAEALTVLAAIAERNKNSLAYLSIHLSDPVPNTGPSGPKQTLDTETLQLIGKRIRSTTRFGDIAAKIDDMEFAVLLASGATVEGVQHAAQKIGTCLSEPVPRQNRMIQLGVIIGYALFPDHTTDVLRLRDLAGKPARQSKELETAPAAVA